MFKKIFSLVLVLVLVFSPYLIKSVFAETTPDKTYRILLEENDREIKDKNDINISISKKSVLGVVYKADDIDVDWNITEIIYYPEWDALYLKCIKYINTDYCDGWQYKVNNTNQDVGMEKKILSTGNKIQLYFQPWGDDAIHISFEIEVYTLGRTQIKQNNVPPEEQKVKFDIEKSVQFLISNIKKENNYLPDMYMDWSIIGLASYNKNLALQFLDFYKNNNEVSEYLMENIRKSMALLVLDQNPYNFEGKNYIIKILNTFDGRQFGEKNLINDDIFALIILQNVGFNYQDKEIKNTINSILEYQNENGSISNSPDMTSAFIQALVSFQNENEDIKNAISKARNYLKNSQGQNGSWNDSVFSTTWVLQSLSLFVDVEKEYENGFIYLANKQNTDGGIFNENEDFKNRIWATSYSIGALTKKTWAQIMNNVQKEIKEIENTNIILDENKENTDNQKNIAGEVLGEETFKFTQFMRFGTRGGEVSELQKRLTLEGFFTGPVTGYFGPLTRTAVRAYQQANPPLKVDGIVGPLTRGVLNGGM